MIFQSGIADDSRAIKGRPRRARGFRVHDLLLHKPSFSATATNASYQTTNDPQYLKMSATPYTPDLSDSCAITTRCERLQRAGTVTIPACRYRNCTSNGDTRS